MSQDSGVFYFTEPPPDKRRVFYDTIARLNVRDPDATISGFAEALRVACGADIVLVWLASDELAGGKNTSRYQLVGIAGASVVPPEITGEACPTHSMGALTVELDEVQGHRDASLWLRTHAGHEYRSTLWQKFSVGFQAKGIVCVPLVRPDPLGDSTINGVRPRGIKGVVTLHYKDPGSAWIFKPETSELQNRDQGALRTMGRMSAMLLEDVRREQKILASAELARLAGKHLARQREDPRTVRREYVRDVISLIQSQLKFQAVTVFARVPFERKLAVVSSTGLYSTQGTTVPIVPNEYSQYGYQCGVGTIGEVCANQKPTVLQESDGRLEAEEARLGVTDIGRHNVGRGVTVLMPLLGLAESSDADAPREPVVAVLRCAAQRAHLSREQLRHFDSIEYETLSFIAEQIAPVLLTFESRILREDVISVVKHDLLVPMHSIRDAVDYLEDPPATTDDQSLLYYKANLRLMSVRLGGLIDQLSRDLLAKRKLKLQRTNLGSEIVAPLKRLMTPFAAESNNAVIDFSGFEDIPPVAIDQAMVERAIYNLVMNALKYGPPKDWQRTRPVEVKIRASKQPGGVAIDVENEGDGIEPEAVPFLFTMHFRSRRARATREGTGLGLSVVRQIMISHGGNALLIQPRNPTIFRLLFPDKLKT